MSGAEQLQKLINLACHLRPLLRPHGTGWPQLLSPHYLCNLNWTAVAPTLLVTRSNVHRLETCNFASVASFQVTRITDRSMACSLLMVNSDVVRVASGSAGKLNSELYSIWRLPSRLISICCCACACQLLAWQCSYVADWAV